MGWLEILVIFFYVEYAKFLKHYEPNFFVFENVVGLLSAKNKDDSFISG